MYVRGWNMKVSFRIKQENEKDLCSKCKLRERQPIMTCYQIDRNFIFYERNRDTTDMKYLFMVCVKLLGTLD